MGVKTMKPIYLEEIIQVQAVLQKVAAQKPSPVPADATPEMVKIHAESLYGLMRTMLETLKEATVVLNEAVTTMNDLSLSKEPEHELMASRIYIAAASVGRNLTPAQAFSSADTFMTHRNAVREGKSKT